MWSPSRDCLLGSQSGLYSSVWGWPRCGFVSDLRGERPNPHTPRSGLGVFLFKAPLMSQRYAQIGSLDSHSEVIKGRGKRMGTRLELTWPNKDKFLLTPRDAEGKPEWVERTHPAANEVRLTDFQVEFGQVGLDPYADNLLFAGDSLDVLRVLTRVPEYARDYRGKIKLIYIDPPFNTGQTFEHYDDWLDHSTWLSFMRDRLLLMKELLSPDGSIWVHLDDAEQHRMRLLMDEVFGSDNFVSNVVWQRVDNPASRATTGVVPSHDTIVVYKRTAEFVANQESRTEIPSHYDKVDAEGAPFCARSLRKAGSSSRREDRPSMWFAITAPDGTDVYPLKADGTEGRWQWGAEKVRRDIHLIDWQKSPRGTWEPYQRIYFDEYSTTPFHSWWSYLEVDSNRISKMEIKALFPGITPFETPKPERLIERVLTVGSNPDDIVLDCFAGSGTTAAVAQKMGRRWVTCELQQSTVDSFTRPRLEKVINGEDAGGISESVGWNGGGGFRTVAIRPSAYAVTDFGVLFEDWATEGDFARLMAGQLGFDYEPDPPFSGRRGRMRLACFPDSVGIEEAAVALSALDASERVTIVSPVILEGVEAFVRENSRGSRVMKAPRDVLRPRRIRRGMES